MLSIGLTGGIGTGKSTVAGILRERGVSVVDADQIARAVVEPGTPGLAAVVDAFGRSVLQKDGSLDRRALGAIVFADARARKRLEAILHPLILERQLEARDRLTREGHALAVFDIPLLFEAEREVRAWLDWIVVVYATPAQQIERLGGRGLSPAEAERRLAAQWPIDEKSARADEVIDNTGSPADLAAAVSLSLKRWTTIANRSDRSR